MTDLSRNDVVAWAALEFGPAYADRRVVEGPVAFWVNSASDAVLAGIELAAFGGSSIVVRKKTGEYWYVSDAPDSAFLYAAKSDWRLRRGLRKAGSRRPVGSIQAAAITRDAGQPPD